MTFRHHHYYAESFLRNGVRYLFVDVAPVEPFKTQYVNPVRKISLWKRLKTAISIFFERLILRVKKCF